MKLDSGTSGFTDACPLVSLEQFNASQRGHTRGKRRSKDLHSGKVRCGWCGRVVGVRYNDRTKQCTCVAIEAEDAVNRDD